VTATCPTSSTTLSINGFSVAVTCSSSTPAYSEAGQSINIFQLTSTATSAGGLGSATYVERSVSAGIEK
jgi:MSHA biogenesis protein MshP